MSSLTGGSNPNFAANRNCLLHEAAEKVFGVAACYRARLGNCFKITAWNASRGREGAVLRLFSAASKIGGSKARMHCLG